MSGVADRPALDGVTLQELAEAFGEAAGDVLPDLVRTYLRQSDESVDALRTHARSGDSALLAAAAHKLRGSTATFGATTLTALLATLEREPPVGAAAERAVDVAAAELARVREALLAQFPGVV